MLGDGKRNADIGQEGGRESRGCGTVRQAQSKQDPALWLVQWVPCDTYTCSDCGPRKRDRLARSYAEKIGAAKLGRELVADAAWSSKARKLRRHGARYVQFPMPGGLRVVLLEGGPGQPVADVAAELAELCASFEAGSGRNVSACKDWQPAAAAPAPIDEGLDQEAAPRGYEFRWFLRTSLEHARQLAEELGLYVGEAAGRGGTAFLIRQGDDQLAWRRFLRWAGAVEADAAPRGRRRRRQAA